MKIINKFLLIIPFFLIVNSCENFGVINKSFAGNPPVTTITPAPLFRGLYVDSLLYIISDTGKQNTLIRWAVRKNFNALYLYNLTPILSTVNNLSKLDSFIVRSKRAGLINISSARASESTSIDVSNTQSTQYYNTRCSINGKITNFNLENEYWNYTSSNTIGNVNFSTWINYKKNMYNFAKTINYTSDAYIGHLKDPGGSSTQTTMADGLVLYNDRILVHDYVDTVKFATTDGAWSYLQSRLDAIGKSAIAKKKVAQIVVIFAGYTADGPQYNMRYYFKYHTFQSAYDKVKASFDKSTFTGKKGINLIGYQIYAYHRVKDL